MGERTPVRTYAELLTLDSDEIAEGFLDGYSGEPEPGDNRSKAYWHGWRNAWLDKRHGPPDADAIELIADMRRHGRFGGPRA